MYGRARRFLIVGGSGYISGPVTSHLLAQGEHMRNLEPPLPTRRCNPGSPAAPALRVRSRRHGDRSTVERALEGVTDVVILAGLVGDPITKSVPVAAANSNDDTVRACVDALDGNGHNVGIFVSTCSNYGIIGEHEIATENLGLKPSFTRNRNWLLSGSAHAR